MRKKVILGVVKIIVCPSPKTWDINRTIIKGGPVLTLLSLWFWLALLFRTFTSLWQHFYHSGLSKGMAKKISRLSVLFAPANSSNSWLQCCTKSASGIQRSDGISLFQSDSCGCRTIFFTRQVEDTVKIIFYQLHLIQKLCLYLDPMNLDESWWYNNIKTLLCIWFPWKPFGNWKWYKIL